MIRRKRSDVLAELGILALLLLLPLLLFAPVALGSKTLLPADSLFRFEPYRAAADDLGVTSPHNHLVADLILENYAWKHFLEEAIHNRELPLWDPYTFAGHPFLANGQHSAFYPLSILFYILPLWRAYGIFAWLQLGLAGIFAYLFARVLGVRRLGGLIAGIAFQFSGFMLVSSVPHPMIIAGASWLPFILAMVELIVQQRPALGRRPATLPWALLGAVGIGCQLLVGHGENTYFTALVAGAYAAWRLIYLSTHLLKTEDTSKRVYEVSRLVRPVLWLAVMAVLGLALGAVQLVPYFEVVSGSFRSGEAAASLEQVLGWAYPPRRLITFGIPNFFGSPAHHGYLDLFTLRWTPAQVFDDGQYIDWGMKNYVEGGAYLGLLPLFLAALAVLDWLKSHVVCFVSRVSRFTFDATYSLQHAIPFFTLSSLFSLGCIFGTPLYALVYALPGIEQSHSPFRWVFPLSLSVAILAGFGVETVIKSRNHHLKSLEAGGNTQCANSNPRSQIRNFLLLGTSPSLVALFAALAFWGGAMTLAGLVFSRIFFAPIEPLIERVFLSLAKAPAAFPGHRAFYSYEFKWTTLFGLLLTGTGIVLRVSRCPIFVRRRPVWEFLAVGLLALDLVAFGLGFGPAVDPALLDYTPPVVEFLRQDVSLWRYASFTPPDTTKTMNANVGMFYGLQAVDGYDSLFTAQYRDYMALIEPQDETQYNRIASFHHWSSLDSPLTDLLNVKYVITEVEIVSPKYQLAYQDDAVRVYENLGAMPRAYTLPLLAALETDDLAGLVQEYDPRNYVILDSGAYPLDSYITQPGAATAQNVTRYTINEVQVDAQIDEPGWLILADSYFPGWKAFVRPQGSGEDAEEQVEIYRVNGNFRGTLLKPGVWSVRFKYSPDSVKIGAFVSFIAGMMALFLIGVYLWRFFYREEPDGNSASTVKRVAKNSIAPIILNLFNRALDMAFAALMARILGPVGAGRYFTAAIIYGWFDIIANFGLEMYLMREVARDRANARRLFVNTTLLRLLLFERGRLSPPLLREMLAQSWPLMVSLLLQMLFTGANGVLLQFWRGDEAAGWYDAARKWVDALNLIPSIFTFAVFPLMSRQAAQDRAGLRQSYRLSVKLLTMIALPAAVLVALLATPLVGLLSGERFLPHGAVALRILIWSIIFGWLNSLTNYVLIALDRQRHVLLASGARVAFAVAANLLFVGRFSYVASAWIIVGGELLLVLLFAADLRRHLGPLGWGRALGRPLLAGVAMSATAWALASFSLPLALLISLVVYPAGLILLRALTPEEWALLSPLLPARLAERRLPACKKR
ncbi:MAG: hypothetical protein B6I35_03350 [Anaerolineaceae bacterium 4572_32.2]|nr:MAG: hypothetical protein B6I35_03350 [Anaerolineaceae bacterium 4572_32.2]